MTKKNIFKIVSGITEGVKDLEEDEHYNTGLIGEGIIVSAYKKMPINKLESMKFIINKIIEKKKKIKRIVKSANTQTDMTSRGKTL